MNIRYSLRYVIGNLQEEEVSEKFTYFQLVVLLSCAVTEITTGDTQSLAFNFVHYETQASC